MPQQPQPTPQQVAVNLQIPPDIKPVYADDAILLNVMKVNVDKSSKKNSITKIPKLELLFYDRNTRTVVSRIVIDVLTAKALGTILMADTEKVLSEMRSDKVPDEILRQAKQLKETEHPSSTSHLHDYIG